MCFCLKLTSKYTISIARLFSYYFIISAKKTIPNIQPLYKRIYPNEYSVEITKSPFVSGYFLKTNFNALKNSPYNIVKIIKRKNQKTASKTIKRMNTKIVIAIQRTIEIIIPPISSPASIPGKSGISPDEKIIQPKFWVYFKYSLFMLVLPER